jgi:glyoxylase-like metal-dependent hydrolase (beta-lactamase superfamily II)/ferredoxin
MPDLKKRRAENVEGPFYVDSTCIDCDACRWIAPQSFHDTGDQSAVFHQPRGEAETMAALQALISCPTASIGTTDKAAQARMKQAIDSFPRPIDANVYHCGFHSESSFGAASWLVKRPQGNVLIDSPRFAMPLVKQVEAMGGVSTMFLSHIDDVADHDKWAAHFGCERVMHADDARGLTIERKTKGREPVRLDSELLFIPTPGHTRGSAVLLYKEKYLFTGDHLAWSPRRNHLIAFRGANWYSWPETIASMKALQAYEFEWVLPGHGRMHYAPAREMAASLARCIAWMEEN